MSLTTRHSHSYNFSLSLSLSLIHFYFKELQPTSSLIFRRNGRRTIYGKIPPGVWFLSSSKFEWKDRRTYKYKAHFTATVAAERANLLTH